MWAWDLNMKGLLNVLEVARSHKLERIFWPSSIAAFGPGTPQDHTPQKTVMDPTTVYGISKLAGEGWCAWYHRHHGVDVRSLRYPGLISWKTPPGGGTTDYAVEIFHAALKARPLHLLPARGPGVADDVHARRHPRHAATDGSAGRRGARTRLLQPGRHQLHAARDRRRDPQTPAGLHDGRCEPDFRQAIAASWPRSIDDSAAQRDWGWRPRYDLQAMVDDMLANLEPLVALNPRRARAVTRPATPPRTPASHSAESRRRRRARRSRVRAECAARACRRPACPARLRPSRG